MNLYELTKKYGEGKGETMMWSVIKVVSDTIENSMDEETKECMMRHLYEKMSDGHYDEHFAKEDVKHMYYVGEDGKEHYAPYWTEEQVKVAYDAAKQFIPKDYNFWDFYVVLNMQKSDTCTMLKEWFPSATSEEMDKKLVREAINWLKDDDNPYGNEKAWKYLNSK